LAFGDPLQLILILGVVAVLLIWGPKKIPELARSLGRVRKDFHDASREPTLSSGTDSVPGDELIATANKLGISTQGKSRQQISDEIVRLAQRPSN
jgi:sec-independent protein translocase protein TatA